jgi:hypothetical protein
VVEALNLIPGLAFSCGHTFTVIKIAGIGVKHDGRNRRFPGEKREGSSGLSLSWRQQSLPIWAFTSKHKPHKPGFCDGAVEKGDQGKSVFTLRRI